MTAKDCGQHHHHDRKKLYRRLFTAAVGLTAVVLFITLLVWLILRPTKPQFTLQDITVTAFNLSSSGGVAAPPNLLTSSLQITLASRNPNSRIGIYYDRVDVYAAYHGQQITLATLLPASYQGHKDVIVWSPFINGDVVPVAPYVAQSLSEDEIAGVVLINVRVEGRIRWKVGTFVSGTYHLYANCPAYINSGGKGYEVNIDCHVDV